MVEVSNKKKRKLPARYPRESEIIIFGGMEDLDHVLGRLTTLGENLSNLSPDTTEEEWGKWVADPLTALIRNLRKACVEYERFWNLENWDPETDQNFMLSMKDSSELRWYISGVEQQPVYDPARLSCMKSLYTALSLKRYSGGKDWIDDCINNLRYELTRYHAAALEIVQERKSVYLSDLEPLASKGRKFTNQKRREDPLSAVLYNILLKLGKSASFKVVWKELQGMAVGSQGGVFQEVDESAVYWRSGGVDKITKSRSIENRLTKIRKII
ncbi:MAG: hypothetical protein Q7S69_09370 [Nitrosomonadaceae bacterium]|nr:hypothetical protein [Nitrosomonadaceae bacterium]